MKNKGFSLMEVLMVLGIIGVVTAMSVSISQKGVEKAYRNYWYTGYSALENATFDAIMKNKTDFDSFTRHIAKLMNIKDEDIIDDSYNRTLKAPNGIKYTFGAVPFNQFRFWPVSMEIPSPKSKNTVQNQTLLVVDFADENNVQLHPSQVSGSTYVNLQTRKDLLPFVIDDGKAPGDITKNKGIYSFKEAYCATHADGKPARSYFPMTMVECTHNNSPIAGQIMSVNPKKVY